MALRFQQEQEEEGEKKVLSVGVFSSPGFLAYGNCAPGTSGSQNRGVL